MNIQNFFKRQSLPVTSLMLIAFCIPLYKKLMVPLILLSAVIILLNYKPGTFKANLRSNKVLFLPVLYYIMVAISLLWTDNMEEGLFDLEVKLSFIAFPLLFLFLPGGLQENDKNKILKSFVWGVTAGVIICLVHATIAYIREPVIYYTFIYSRLSVIHHPTYFAMYINFAIVVLLVWQRQHKIPSLPSIILTMILLLFSWLLMSRSGLITSGVIILYYWGSLFFERKFKGAVIMLIAGIILVFTLLQTSRYTKTRLTSIIPIVSTLIQTSDDVTSESSKDSRIITWEAAIHSIREHPVLGAGTGDVHSALNDYYEANNHHIELERELNAHNQFLQSWVAIGIAGFIIVLLMFLFGIRNSVNVSKLIVTGFFIILALTMFIESIYETQSGVVFFCFFLCFFLIGNQPERK